MNANELRIGNYIHVSEEGSLEVLKIDLNDMCNLECTIDKDMFEPIPLTEEWLLKLGAKQYMFDDIKTNEYMFNKWFTVSLVNEQGFCQLCLSNRYLPVHLEYVHQLQNMVWILTNKELTIK